MSEQTWSETPVWVMRCWRATWPRTWRGNGLPLVLGFVLPLGPADINGLRIRAGRVDERPLGQEVQAVQQNDEVVLYLGVGKLRDCSHTHTLRHRDQNGRGHFYGRIW